MIKTEFIREYYCPLQNRSNRTTVIPDIHLFTVNVLVEILETQTFTSYLLMSLINTQDKNIYAKGLLCLLVGQHKNYIIYRLS